MSQKATASYTQLTWVEAPVAGAAAKTTIATQTRKFTGDMEGQGTAVYVMSFYDQKEGCHYDAKTAYTGQQVFSGTILGRKGTVTLNTVGTYDHGALDAKWEVVPETATGDLKGIAGKGGYKLEGQVGCDSVIPCWLEVTFAKA